MDADAFSTVVMAGKWSPENATGIQKRPPGPEKPTRNAFMANAGFCYVQRFLQDVTGRCIGMLSMRGLIVTSRECFPQQTITDPLQYVFESLDCCNQPLRLCKE